MPISPSGYPYTPPPEGAITGDLHYPGLRWADAYVKTLSPAPVCWYLPLWVDGYYPPDEDAPIVTQACHESTTPEGIRILWHAIPYSWGAFTALRTVQYLQLAYLAPATACLTPTVTPPAPGVPPLMSDVAIKAWEYLHPRYRRFDSAPPAPEGEVSTPPADEGERKSSGDAVDPSTLSTADRVQYLEAALTMERLALKNQTVSGDPAKPDSDRGGSVPNAGGNAGIAEEFERSERSKQDIESVLNAARKRGFAYGATDPDEIAGVVDNLDLPDMPGL